MTGRSFMLITSRCLRVLKKIPRELTNHNATTNWEIYQEISIIVIGGTCTKRGMQLRLLMTALLCASLAKICRAPTQPSTMSSILTPSITTLCPGLLCISWWALIISWTSWGRPPCSRMGVWLRGHNARLRMRPTIALMSGQREGGYRSFTKTGKPKWTRTAFWAFSASSCRLVKWRKAQHCKRISKV